MNPYLISSRGSGGAFEEGVICLPRAFPLHKKVSSLRSKRGYRFLYRYIFEKRFYIIVSDIIRALPDAELMRGVSIAVVDSVATLYIFRVNLIRVIFIVKLAF